ncbi:MAG TPA: DUF2085 domain-containing protein [Thermoplasmata archaeon]
MASWVWAKLTWSRALFLLLALNLLWTASLFIAPFTIPPGSFAHEVGGANTIDHEDIWQTFSLYPRAVYTFGDFQCHQLWSRSLWLNGNQLPIDARMTSMYIFANFGLVAAALATPSTSTGQVMLNALPESVRRRLAKLGPEKAGALIVVIGLLPIAIDGFTQLFSSVTHYESTNLTRILTGMPGGFVGGLLVGAMLVSMRQFSADLQMLRARSASRAPQTR